MKDSAAAICSASAAPESGADADDLGSDVGAMLDGVSELDADGDAASCVAAHPTSRDAAITTMPLRQRRMLIPPSAAVRRTTEFEPYAGRARARVTQATHEGLTEEHLLEALERRGHVRRLVEISPIELWQTAVHEAGHALLAYTLFGPDSLNRVSILPTAHEWGNLAGHFEYRDEWHERQRQSASGWSREVMVGYGGMLAEELVLGGVGRGSSDDLISVSRLLTSRTLAGLDPDLGPVSPVILESAGSVGSEAMRARLWSLAERHGRELLGRARLVLEPQLPALKNFAATSKRTVHLNASARRMMSELREMATPEPGLELVFPSPRDATGRASRSARVISTMCLSAAWRWRACPASVSTIVSIMLADGYEFRR